MSRSSTSWVVDWLTPGRYAKYLRAAGSDEARALAIYEWNTQLAAAMLHDLSHLEVAIRNAYDAALLAHPDHAGADWIDPAVFGHLLPEHVAVDAAGNPQDKNATPRNQIRSARRACGYVEGGTVLRGKVVAEFSFGFWTYLTDSLHEKTLWVPALHKAFAPGTDRKKVHHALASLRELRNRVAHHESVFDQDLELNRRFCVAVAGWLSPDIKAHIVSTSCVQELLASKP